MFTVLNDSIDPFYNLAFEEYVFDRMTGGDALHKAAQENPVSDPEPELDIRSDSGEADGGITLQL